MEKAVYIAASGTSQIGGFGFIDENQNVWGTGRNTSSRLTNPPATVVTRPYFADGNNSNAQVFSIAGSHTSYLSYDGTDWAVCKSGDGSGGTLGDGTLDDRIELECNPIPGAPFAGVSPSDLICSVDTDGDGTPDYLDTDSDNDGCFDAYEAGHGQAVDVNGMIATTEAEVGSNGLDNDVETDDTQSAGITYTITQTNSGTNDFQDAAINDCNSTLAENDINQTPEDAPVSGNVLTNDTDEEGDSQTVQSFTYLNMSGTPTLVNVPDGGASTSAVDIYDAGGTLAGSISFQDDGTYNFTPASGYTGSVPLSYVAEDDGSPQATDIATLDIDVIPSDDPTSNEPPVANDDTNTTEENTAVSGNVIDPNDSDPDTPQDDLVLTEFTYEDMAGMPQTQSVPGDGSSSAPVNIYDANGDLAGTISFQNDGDYSYTPQTDYTGEVPVTYMIEDPQGNSDSAVLTVTVEPNVGNATYANDDASVGNEDEVQMGNILANDHDPEGDDQDVALIDSDGDGTPETAPLAGNPISITEGGSPVGSLTIDPETGAYSFEPVANFSGTVQIPYRATDGNVSDDATLFITVLELPCINFNLHIYLEGSLINPQTGNYLSNMRTTLNDSKLLPGQFSENPFTGDIYTPILGSSGQAYNVAPWNYAGSEGTSYDSEGMSINADAGYPNTVTDWVLVSLRSDPTDGSEVLCQRAGLLHSDGSISFLPDADCCDLDQSQSYYVVIEHRNHLIVMSREALPVSNGTITYDFRDKQSYINDPFMSGSFVGQKEIPGLTGVYAMFAGNGDQSINTSEDTDITASDFSKWLSNGAENRVYKFIDYNMDGDVSALDFELWQRNSPRFTSVPRD